MGITYKAVLKAKKTSDSYGIVNIRKTEDRKQSFYSLKVRLPKRYWNSNSGTVRKNSDYDFEDINQKIADKIKELEALSSQGITNPNQNNKRSFITHFESFTKRYTNGSRIKYQTVLNKLKNFLKDSGKKDLLFNEIDENMFYDFRNYTLKRASNNTATHYLKLIKQVLNNAIQLNHYNYIRHPFLAIELKNTKVKKTALSETEINKLLNYFIPETEPLFNIRNCFTAQIFLQGMRVSDLQLLRYSRIKGECIEYDMFKTGTFMSVYVSDLVWNIFIYQFKKLLKKHSIDLKALSSLEQELTQAKGKAVDLLKSEGITTGFELIIDQRIKNSETNDLFEVEPIFKEIKSLKERLFISYKATIKEFGKNNPDYFIFDFLQNVDFKNIKNNDFTKVTENQYKILKNKSIVYNRHLKQLQALTGIETNLKSHLSRSSYASLLLNSGIDVYNISAALGHSGLNITEKYLAGFNRSNTAEINKGLSSKFHK